jgi:hypothetical protein
LQIPGRNCGLTRVAACFTRPSPPFFFPLIDRYAYLAIYPYPLHLVSHYQLADGKDITIRPIRPEDAEIERPMNAKL